jgi:hypothetical protein
MTPRHAAAAPRGLVHGKDDWASKVSLRRRLFPLTELARDPLKFESFGLFADAARRGMVSVKDRAVQADFVAEFRASIQGALANETFLHGHVTQSMFEAPSLALEA